jgi:hypothetical protein
MKQPKTVKVNKLGKDRIFKELSDDALDCKLQEREEGDNSKIVYVTNPLYVKGTQDPMTAAPLVAITSGDYEVVEWTE